MMNCLRVKTRAWIVFLIFGFLSNHSQGLENKGDDTCKHVPKRAINTAFLTFVTEALYNERNVTLTVNTISTECYTCNLQPTITIEPQRNSCTILVDTRWKMKVSIGGDNFTRAASNCSENHLSTWFDEGGNYSIFISLLDNKISCGKPILNNWPNDSNIPLYVALGSFVGLSLLWLLLKYCYRTHVLRRLQNYLLQDSDAFTDTNDYSQQDLGLPTNLTEEDVNRRPAKERLKSLDAFRGISIIIMIFVNYGGGDYWFFKHSKWNGLTVADLVFPWFIWIMGTALAYSMRSQLRNLTSKKRIFWKIFKRSCILFALGLLINSSDGLNPVKMKSFRIPGVLQRFAGTYLIVATLHMIFAKPNDTNQYAWWKKFRDLTDYGWEWLINIVLMVVWLVVTFSVDVPGCGKGYLGPGGLANDGGHQQNVSQCTGGVASYIDRKFFGTNRIYQHPSCKEIYQSTVPHDPEGLLGTLTSCLLCFLGLQAGKILLTYPDWKARVYRFLLWGVLLGVIAVGLCEGSKNEGVIPINKNLWSLSFVMCTGCFAFFLFAFCYVTIDVYKIWSGAPFYYPGMNAIVLYMGHEFFHQPFRTFWGIQPRSHEVYLPINILDTAVWIFLSYFMFKKNIFISI
ncbi:hypothetical protein ACF0H5_001875 [Mactra antiquata]